MALTDYAVMPLADYRAAVTAIQNKNGHSRELISSELADEINAITTGVDVSATTATAADVRTGKVFYTAAGVQTNGTLIAGLKAYRGSFTKSGSSSAITIYVGHTIKYVYFESDATESSTYSGITKRVGKTWDASGGIATTYGLFTGKSAITHVYEYETGGYVNKYYDIVNATPPNDSQLTRSDDLLSFILGRTGISYGTYTWIVLAED